MSRTQSRLRKLERNSNTGFLVVMMTSEPDLWDPDCNSEAKRVAIGWDAGKHVTERRQGETYDAFRSRAEHEATLAAKSNNPGPLYLGPSTRRL